jgi:hypothetical protein
MCLFPIKQFFVLLLTGFLLLKVFHASASENGRAKPGQAVAANPVLSAGQAVTRPGETVQIEMKVRSSKLRTDRDEVDLNSHTSFRDPANLAVVFTGNLIAWYSYQGIHDLPRHFFGNTIRVVGVVEDFAGQRRIVVSDPAQIEIRR